MAVYEGYLAQGHEELKHVSDAKLCLTYDTLRDECHATEAGTYYPNVQRLCGTAFEREKDRREVDRLVDQVPPPEMQAWYDEARRQPCVWWLDNHLVARHALKSCLYCGVCTAQCPAAQYYADYNPRTIVDVALSRDEERLVELLQSDVLWYCGQCGSCKPKCPRENNIMGLISVAAVSQSAQGLPPGQHTGPAAVRRPAPVGRQFLEPRLQPVFPQRRRGRPPRLRAALRPVLVRGGAADAPAGRYA